MQPRAALAVPHEPHWRDPASTTPPAIEEPTMFLSYTILIRLFSVLALVVLVVGICQSTPGIGLFGAAIFGTMSLCLIQAQADDRKYSIDESGE